MEKSLAIRIVAILSYILLGLSLLIGVTYYVTTTPSDAPLTDPMLIFSYTLFGLLVVVTIVFTLIGMFSTKKAAIDSLKVIGIAGVLVLVSYLMSSSEIPTFFGVEELISKQNLTAAKLQLIDTSLFLMYILTGFAFVGLIYSEIRAAFK